MKKYFSVLRICFINRLQYRAAALGGVATQFAWGFMSILGFLAFYRINPDNFSMSFSQTVSYIWLQQAFLALFYAFFFESSIFSSITDGNIAYDTVRPIDLYTRWFFQSIGMRLSSALLRCIPILLVAFILPEPFRMSLPSSPFHLLLFLLSVSFSLCVIIAILQFVYISVIYTLSPTGIRIMSIVLIEFLSGGIIPIPFFPEPFRTIAEFLPFGAIQNIPLRIYNGNISGFEIVEKMGLQIAWIVVLVFLGKLFMKKALRKVIVQGG